MECGAQVTSSHLYTAKITAVNATQVLGLIRRSFRIDSTDMFIFLYKMYVRPHLEYCVQSWNLYLARDIDTLEKVQRHATKHLHRLAHITYESLLKFWISILCIADAKGVI